MNKKMLALCALALACAWPVAAKPMYVTASQNYVTQEVTGLRPFTALSVNGQAEVDFKQGADGQYGVTIYGSDNLADLVQIDSDGTTLRVEYKEPLVVMGKGRLNIMVTAPMLERVEVRQAGEVEVRGPLTAQNLALYADGKGDIQFYSVNAAQVKSETSGDAEIDFDNLSCQSLDVLAAGTSSFEADRAACDAVSVKAESRAEVSVTGIAGRNVSAYATDNSEVKLKGNVLQADLAAHERAELEAGSLRAETVSVAVTGSAHAEVYASQTLNADARNKAVVEYKGYPTEVNRQGKEGNIRQDR